jgi:hypothetical protein
MSSWEPEHVNFKIVFCKLSECMVLAISLIKGIPDHERVVYLALKEMEGIKNLYHIFGNHDFFLIIEAESMNSLIRLLNTIEGINSVSVVKTMLVRPTGWLGMKAAR